MKPRQRLLRNLVKFHLKKVNDNTDFVETEKVSKVLSVLSRKIMKRNPPKWDGI